MSSRNFSFCNRKGHIIMVYITFQTVKQAKTETNRVVLKKMKILSKKGHSKILVSEICFRPPKLGAKSPVYGYT